MVWSDSKVWNNDLNGFFKGLAKIAYERQMNKGGKFLKKLVTASVGEYSR